MKIRVIKDVWQTHRQQNIKRENDTRNAYERDFARIVHCPSFRRLQGKTQVLGLGDSDFYRTRLTHSMEVAQVAAAIVTNLRSRLHSKAYQTKLSIDNLTKGDLLAILPQPQLSSAHGLAHDLGHPPFGHGGETALNYCMREYGGFEANGQTLRILTRLEEYTESMGINPSRRLLLGILKYPLPYSEALKCAGINYKQENPLVPWLIKKEDYKPPKCYLDTEHEIVQWVLQPFSKSDRKKLTTPFEQNGKLKNYTSLDTSILNIADDICYSVHDLEDAIHLKLISKNDFNEELNDWSDSKQIFKEIDRALASTAHNRNQKKIATTLKDLFDSKYYKQKEDIGRLIHIFITHCNFVEVHGFSDYRLSFNIEEDTVFRELRKKLGEIVSRLVINSPKVQQLEFKGQRIIIELFDLLANDPQRFLQNDDKIKYKDAHDEASKMRVICDYIAGMTDEYASKLYERLFCPHRGSLFEQI